MEQGLVMLQQSNCCCSRMFSQPIRSMLIWSCCNKLSPRKRIIGCDCISLLGAQCLEGHGRKTRPTNQPTKKEVSEYWGGVIGVSGHFDPEDPAISGWQELLGPIPSSNAGTVDGSV